MDALVEELHRSRTLEDDGLLMLLKTQDRQIVDNLHSRARETTVQQFGKDVYLRGLIEWSNACRNDCLYCGIRKSASVPRYTLSEEEILASCDHAWRLGIRTFVLQGGENPAAAAGLARTVALLRSRYPETAITLSLGELPFETYRLLRESGANRYLLRHETASAAHYMQLHPAEMRLETRLQCLQWLKELGYQTGMGMMVGSPFQTVEDLLEDIRLMERFQPQMIGIGPFVPCAGTPMATFPAGSIDLTLRLYSILRLMHPQALIPSTTALSALNPAARMEGILAGANVLMPVFTPLKYRPDYALYNGKTGLGTEAAENLENLKKELAGIGYHVSDSRGDYKA